MATESSIKTMKIDRLIVELRLIRKIYGNLPCAYSIDDEGNDYHEVLFSPTQMKMEVDRFGNLELVLPESEDEIEKNPNYVCIN
mgnify:CR=1 FL=1